VSVRLPPSLDPLTADRSFFVPIAFFVCLHFFPSVAFTRSLFLFPFFLSSLSNFLPYFLSSLLPYRPPSYQTTSQAKYFFLSTHTPLPLFSPHTLLSHSSLLPHASYTPPLTRAPSCLILFCLLFFTLYSSKDRPPSYQSTSQAKYSFPSTHTPLPLFSPSPARHIHHH
jgi:hypothetical protein